MKIVIVNGSVRQTQATHRVTKWVEKTARQSIDGTDIEIVDLDELALPMFDEAILPMMNKDRQPTGSLKTWLDALDSADGYVFVTPEYNHGMPAGLKNAIDYISFQIMKKPFLVVAHGANGGARSAEQLKNVLNASIGAVSIPSSVNLNGAIGYRDLISEDGEIQDDSIRHQQETLEGKLQELVWYTSALKNAREQS